MRKIILKWLLKDKEIILKCLLKEKEIKDYWKLFEENIKIRKELISTIDSHLETLKTSRENCDTFIKVPNICKEHNICVEEELEI